MNSRLVGPCLAGLSTRARPPINLNIKTQSLHYMYREPHTQGTPVALHHREPHTQGTPVDAASARLLACSSSSCECIVASLIASTGGMAAMVTEQSGMLGSVTHRFNRRDGSDGHRAKRHAWRAVSGISCSKEWPSAKRGLAEERLPTSKGQEKEGISKGRGHQQRGSAQRGSAQRGSARRGSAQRVTVVSDLGEGVSWADLSVLPR